MYTIIHYQNDKMQDEILQILNGDINKSLWDSGDTRILYKICADNAELQLEAALIDPNWESKFDVAYLKKIV